MKQSLQLEKTGYFCTVLDFKQNSIKRQFVGKNKFNSLNNSQERMQPRCGAPQQSGAPKYEACIYLIKTAEQIKQ